jgi:DNA primase
MVDVSHAERIVFPEIGRTKGDVVAYWPSNVDKDDDRQRR